jgi:superfamily II DNA/RNA helicase
MTGGGKTAAFLLPIMQRLLARRRGGAARRAFVLTPTRELAAQIDAQSAATPRPSGGRGRRRTRRLRRGR